MEETKIVHKKKGITIKLRFKEFNEQLLPTKFGKVVESNLYGPRFNAEDYSENGNVKTIRGTDLGRDGEIKYEQVPLAQLDENTVANHKLQDGDIVMITTADCGATGVFRKQNIDYLSSAYGVRIRLNELGFPYYFKYFFQTRLAKKEINSFIRKATVANLPGSDILKIKLYLPSINEQQKIASFLSAVDEKLQLLNHKKQLLEQYKKGVMQQLFSGKLRFKDENGKVYPKWEEKKLGDFVLSHKGGAPLTPNDFTKISGCEVIPKKGITSGGRLIIDAETPTYCKPAFYESYSKSVIDKSYLITTLRDLVPSGPSIGYIVQYNSNNKYILAQGVYALKIDESKLNREWIIQFSNTTKYRKVMQTIMVGSTQVHIRNEEFFQVKLNLPYIEEQKKIADFLSAIDVKIESLSKQINQTQNFKKGLLQQMFV